MAEKGTLTFWEKLARGSRRNYILNLSHEGNVPSPDGLCMTKLKYQNQIAYHIENYVELARIQHRLSQMVSFEHLQLQLLVKHQEICYLHHSHQILKPNATLVRIHLNLINLVNDVSFLNAPILFVTVFILLLSQTPYSNIPTFGALQISWILILNLDHADLKSHPFRKRKVGLELARQYYS